MREISAETAKNLIGKHESIIMDKFMDNVMSAVSTGRLTFLFYPPFNEVRRAYVSFTQEESARLDELGYRVSWNNKALAYDVEF